MQERFILVEPTDLYAKPQDHTTILGTLDPDDEVIIQSEDGLWLKVEVNDRYGWIHASAIPEYTSSDAPEEAESFDFSADDDTFDTLDTTPEDSTSNNELVPDFSDEVDFGALDSTPEESTNKSSQQFDFGADEDAFNALDATSPPTPKKKSTPVGVVSKSTKKSTTTTQTDLASSEITRLVAAGAITLGQAFRRRVINYYEHPYRATAPEIGLDPEIVLRVCYHIEEEMGGNSNRWIWALLGLFLLIIPVVGWIAYIILVVVLFNSGPSEDKIRDKYAEHFKAGTYNPGNIRSIFNKADEHMLKNARQKEQNVTVYSGFYPFVGAGQLLRNWSFPVDIGKYHDDDGDLVEPEKFELSELYDYVVSKIDELEFDNVEVSDYLFAYGADMRQEKALLDSALSTPRTQVNASYLQQHMESSSSRIRYYKWIKLTDWDGEVVLSFFLRFSRRGSRTLFIESSNYILTPLNEKLHEVDKEPEKPGCFNIGAQAAINAERGRRTAVLKAVEQLFPRLTGQALQDLKDEISRNPRYNYGVSKSIREIASAERFTRYFQYMDKEMYVKILDRLILQAIETFLDEKDVYIASFQESKSVVINHGIMGDVVADNLAVGEGAQANNTQPQNAVMNAVQQFTGQGQKN